jgi:pimeloyl-ACP methyl ester carboxylesterase
MHVVMDGGTIDHCREAIESLVAYRTEPLLSLINARPRSPTIEEIRGDLSTTQGPRFQFPSCRERRFGDLGVAFGPHCSRDWGPAGAYRLHSEASRSAGGAAHDPPPRGQPLVRAAGSRGSHLQFLPGVIPCSNPRPRREDDPTIPIECQEDIIAALTAYVRFERFPNCGHSVINDAPERAFAVIRSFIA